MSKNVIIIGAGAAGLYAAWLLSKENYNITLLEARDRPGGRINSVKYPTIPIILESGAEFIHGEAEITRELIKEFKLDTKKVEGRLWQFREGKFIDDHDFIENSDELEKKLKQVETEMAVKDFLETNFPGDEHEALRNSVRHFVEGYDAADYSRASTLAFKEEWLNSSWKQYRFRNGYLEMMEALLNECENRRVNIQFFTRVEEIHWNETEVRVYDSTGKLFMAGIVLVTLPLGVLNSDGKFKVRFNPEPAGMKEALQNLGYGNVVKIIFYFRSRFWEDDRVMELTGTNLKDLGFIFSDAGIPTWWTQEPETYALLTGWIGGPEATALIGEGDEKIYQTAIQSLSYIFGLEPAYIESEIVEYKIADWADDEFSAGAYSYATVEGRSAVDYFNSSFNNTMYFAGEHLNPEFSFGTVEAAFLSARHSVTRILELKD